MSIKQVEVMMHDKFNIICHGNKGRGIEVSGEIIDDVYVVTWVNGKSPRWRTIRFTDLFELAAWAAHGPYYKGPAIPAEVREAENRAKLKRFIRDHMARPDVIYPWDL